MPMMGQKTLQVRREAYAVLAGLEHELAVAFENADEEEIAHLAPIVEEANHRLITLQLRYIRDDDKEASDG
jgi:hypothetical protein